MELEDLTPEEYTVLLAKAQATLTIDDLNPAVKQQLYQEAKESLYRQMIVMQQAQIDTFKTFASLAVDNPIDFVNTNIQELPKTTSNTTNKTVEKDNNEKTKNRSKSNKNKKAPKGVKSNDENLLGDKPKTKPQFDKEFAGAFGNPV